MGNKYIGKCIYCLNDNPTIDEHVMPLALGGIDKMIKASCHKCANITSLIIRKVTKDQDSILYRARILLDMPTRRPAQRPSKLTQHILDQRTNETEEIEVDPKDYIDTTLFPVYPLPGIFNGNLDLPISIPEAIPIHTNKQKVQQGKSYRCISKGHNNDFPRLLALLAYCSSVYEFGLEENLISPVIHLILGEKEDFGTWIGTAPDQKMELHHKFVDIAYTRPNNHILMRIKFFAWLRESPEYLVAIK